MKKIIHSRQISLNCAPLLLMVSCLMGYVAPVNAIQKPYAAFADGDGNIYTVAKNGALRWYQHNGRMSGKDSWENFGEPRTVYDKATQNNRLNSKIFSGDDGVIYTINNRGQLLWSRHDGRFSGTQSWGNKGKLTVIGNGWNQYSHVFSAGDGVIYAITAAGKMFWFRHIGWLDGSRKWASGSGEQISKGWKDVTKVFSGGNGVIYSIMPTGRLRWHRHDGRLSGSDSWFEGGIHRVVGFNWQNYSQVFTGGDGIIYGIKANGDLEWHRHTGWLTGTDAWAPEPKTDAGKIMARGWVLP